MLEKPTGIPRRPGCYLFRNGSGVVIYVGKARSLAQRLSSYFQRSSTLSQKTQLLMDEAAAVEWIVTPSELDALVLENELIKVNQPRYNMRLKDDKSFPYVALDSRVDFPVPTITRGQHVKGVRYFGPFVDVGALRRTIDELLQAFPLRTCSRHKYNYQQRIGRPCLLFDIGKCPGPCVGAITASEYSRNVESWAGFFDGDVRPLRLKLQAQMSQASQSQHYEAAAQARDSLEALESAAQRQSVVLDDYSALDVIAAVIKDSRAVVVRFRVRHGRIVGRTVHLVDRSMDEQAIDIIEGLLPQLYPREDEVPPTVLLSDTELISPLVAQFLAERPPHAVSLSVPQRGRRRRVCDMARADAESIIARDDLRRARDHNVRARALQELSEALGLTQPPYRIECYDMSHLQGTNYVGSMVVFEDGLALKSDYRRFTIREVVGNDDVGAMTEVLARRFKRWNATDAKFRPADLIIIDGGLPQLSAGISAATQAGIMSQVQLVSLAKREELLYRPSASSPIALPPGSEALYLVQRIRDEAHRFAITFHRSKRGQAMIRSSLDGVAGLGPARRIQLLEHFGSLDALRSATLDDLYSLSFLPSNVAHNLYDHLRSPSSPRPEKGTVDHE